MTGDFRVLTWWGALLAISAGNLGLWAYAATRPSSAAPRDERAQRARRTQLALSLVYVLGCAFRSVLPSVEARRFVLWDHWLSSAAVGRTVATFAELAFALQWLLLINAPSADSSRTAKVARRLLLPLILSAELCSWYATISTNQLGGVIEESLWALAAALMLLTFQDLLRRNHGPFKRWLLGATLATAGFFIFLVGVDVPMYWNRWRADQAEQHEPLSLKQGFTDASKRRIPTQRWHDWQAEIPWMSLYFSLGVWMSIALTRAQVLEAKDSDN